LYLLFRGAMYFIWCVLQQVLLDNLIYRRLRDDLGPAWRISIIAGSLFAIAHLPNPVLVRSTLAWGAVASRLFEKRRSVIALAFFRPSFPHCFFGPRP
jgi:membrane protease YdiL (CAAX protease family)